MKLSFATTCLVLSLVAGAAACATDSSSCDLNETRACVCPDGQPGAQSCDASGDWTACSCTGGSGAGGGGGGGGGGGSGGGSGGATFKHGTICTSPNFACGTANNLVCTVEEPTDSQGVCRLSCSTFGDCLNNADALNRFDTDCCDIGNGSRVCGQKSQWPDGACN